MSKTSPRKLRRIVTGHDCANKAKVIIDGIAGNLKTNAPTSASIAVWASDTMPVEISLGEIGSETGDAMVQRGTNHAWMNRSNARARLSIVLVDAKPLGICHPRK